MSRKRAEVPGIDQLFKGRTAPEEVAPTGEESPPPALETAENQETETLESQEVKMSTSPEGEKLPRPEVPLPKTEQVTVYFSPETVKLIETARYHLRVEDGIKATKSALVEACVLAAIRDKEWLKEQLAGE